jgi:hypothetical protein
MKNINWESMSKAFQSLTMAACMIFAMLYFKGCSDNNTLKQQIDTERKITVQNQRALTDQIRLVINKAGENTAVTSAFVTKMSDLEKLNKELHNELKKEIGVVKGLIRTGVVVHNKPVEIDNELISYDDGFGLSFKHTTGPDSLGYSHIEGISKFKLVDNKILPGKTLINKNIIKVPLVLGFKEHNDNFEVFARSINPDVEIDELQGVLLIPKKHDITMPPVKNKKIGIGPQVGFGVGPGFRPGIYMGIGVQYSIIKF